MFETINVAPSITSVIKHETVVIELEEVAFMTTVNVVDLPFIVLGVILDTLDPLPDHV